MCVDLVQERGVLLLPASTVRSELTPTSADRFHLGRRSPQEGLARWAAWPEVRG